MAPLQYGAKMRSKTTWQTKRTNLVMVVFPDTLAKRCAELEGLDSSQRQTMKMWGLPFVVKDNIDVAHMPTTAGCPAYKYMPDKNAATVQAVLD